MRLVKLLKKSPHIRSASETLSSPQSSQEEVGGASADVFKIVYGEHVDRGGLAFKILREIFGPTVANFNPAGANFVPTGANFYFSAALISKLAPLDFSSRF